MHLQRLEDQRDQLKKDDHYRRFAYVTYEDLDVLNRKYPCQLGEEESDESMESDGRHADEFNSVLLAVRAPPGSKIQA